MEMYRKAMTAKSPEGRAKQLKFRRVGLMLTMAKIAAIVVAAAAAYAIYIK